MHPRLTVARAGVEERRALLAHLPQAVPGAVAYDAADLLRAAEALAAERSTDRAALRARLDAVARRLSQEADEAHHRLDAITASHQEILDGADWARRTDGELADHVAAIVAARAALDARQAEQRAARSGLDKVLEQRAVAGAAMEDADRQLAELVGVGMDESTLRRELEAAGQAVREARAAHAAAVARAQGLVAERQELEHRRAELEDGLASASTPDAHPREAVDRVVEALGRWNQEASLGEPDPDAQALARAFEDLRADRAELEREVGPAPDHAALALVEAEVARASAELERFGARRDEAVLDEGQRSELDAAHEAVLLAEERVGRRIGAASARQRLEAARHAEQELLERFGFASYLDVVLSGGRVAPDSPERLAAERSYLAATAARDALRRGLRASPELQYLETEDVRLHAHAVATLGVEPGDAVIDLLRRHPRVSRPTVEDLRDALLAVGVRPVGVSLPTAADEWLATEVALAEEAERARSGAADLRAELDRLGLRLAELDEELAAAGYGEADAAQQLEMAGRSVGAFEAELSVRAGEDETRLKRFAAAEQLRTQIEALAATLVRAEEEAMALLDRVTDAAAGAELDLDRAEAVLTDIAHRARQLAGGLPADRRPEGDPLTTLVALSERLTEHADRLGPDLEGAAEAAARATTEADEARAAGETAGTGAEGPRTEDLHDALSGLVQSGRGAVTVLGEPFEGLDPVIRGGLLRVITERRDGEPIVLLTDDADTLGWAIGLPEAEATVVSADTLLNLDASGADTSTGAPSTVSLRSPSPTDDEASDLHDPHPSARRSAGRR